MQPNPEQQLAVQHLDGPCIVTSVPGSGKTFVLANRTAYLVKNAKVSPTNILCLTFTNKATNEMKERIEKYTSHSIASSIWISTFHKLCISILRKFGSTVGVGPNFVIYDDDDQISLMSKVARMLGHEFEKSAIKYMCSCANNVRESVVETLDDHTELDSDQRQIIEEYWATIDRMNVLDYTAILYKTYLVLQNKDVCQKLADKFKYVLVDETQDTNAIQYEIIKKIGGHGNIFVVGDQQQSVFGFRGSKPENIDLIKTDFSNVKEITLSRNYRSTPQILSVAQKFIRHNSNAKHVVLQAEGNQSFKHGNNDVELVRAMDAEDEAQKVVDRIRYLVKQGHSYSDFAILYRTNYQSKVPELALRRADIPYKLIGGFSFFDRSEIKTAIAYLSYYANPFDSVSFHRAMSTPKRGVGDASIGKIEKVSLEERISIRDAANKTMTSLPAAARTQVAEFLRVFDECCDKEFEYKSLGQLCLELLRKTGYYTYIEQESLHDTIAKKRIDNLNELLATLDDYSTKHPGARVNDFLHSIKLFTTGDDKDDEEGVTLLTMHSAKGLEFPVVFIIGMQDGLVPHKMSVAEGNIPEERRLCYVAITRGRQKLYLSYADRIVKFDTFRKTNTNRPCFPSYFLEEMGFQLPEY